MPASANVPNSPHSHYIERTKMTVANVVSHWHGLRVQWWLLWTSVLLILLTWVNARTDAALEAWGEGEWSE